MQKRASSERARERAAVYGDAGQAYVYGNAAPKREYAPQEPLRRGSAKKVSGQVRRNRKNALYVNAGYVLFLTVMAAAALVICIKYVNLQSETVRRSKRITALQEELASVREENNTKYNTIIESMTLDEIQQRAVDLGMVHVSDNQIIEYDISDGGSVKQYKRVPEDGAPVKAKEGRK